MVHFQCMKIAHSRSHVSKFLFTYLYTFYCIANHHSKEVELFHFESNKWESKPEWNYPFNGEKG